MKIYFGQVSQEQIYDWGSEGLVKSADGNYFSGYIEFGSNSGGVDDVVVHDGCGRSIPLCVDNLFEISAAFRECATIASELQDADKMRTDVENSEFYGTVCEQGHIHY